MLPGENDKDPVQVLLALYVAITDLEIYWSTLDSVTDFFETADPNNPDAQLDSHAESLTRLAENLRPQLFAANEVNERPTQLTLSDTGKIIHFDERLIRFFACKNPKTYADLASTSTHLQRIHRLLKTKSTGAIIIPLFEHNKNAAGLARVYYSDFKQAFCVELLEHDPPDGFRQILQQDFGVTNAEFIVLADLIRGISVNEIALNRNKSTATIRNQIKSLTNKLFTNSQLGLVSHAKTLALLPPNRPALPAPKNANLLMIGTKQIQYFVFGPASKKVWLYFYHTTDGPLISEKLTAELYARDVQLISVARPGCGASSLVSNDDPLSYLMESVRPYRHVLNHLKVKKCVVISSAAGLAFATAFLQKNSDVVSAVQAYNPFPPFNSWARCQALPGRWKPYATTVCYSPKFTQSILSLAFNHSKLDPRLIAKKIIADDVRACIADKDFEDLVSSVEENFTLTQANSGQTILNEASVVRIAWDKLVGVRADYPPIFLVQGRGHYSLPDKILKELACALGAKTVQLPNVIGGPIIKVNPTLMFNYQDI